MASLELRNQIFRVVFMYRGRKYSYSLKTRNRYFLCALCGYILAQFGATHAVSTDGVSLSIGAHESPRSRVT